MMRNIDKSAKFTIRLAKRNNPSIIKNSITPSIVKVKQKNNIFSIVDVRIIERMNTICILFFKVYFFLCAAYSK